MTETSLGQATTETSLDELGPVDYIVVEFPAGASNFTGEMAKELLALVDAGTIRVIDVLILTKNEDGFIPLQEEQYDFIVPTNRMNRPAVRAFGELLADAQVRSELLALGFQVPQRKAIATAT